MPLRAIFQPSVGSNVDISSRIRAYQMSVTAYAEQGSVAMSQLEVDDPEGGINILGLRILQLREEAESSNQRVIYRGFAADRDIVRHESLRTGAARLWRVNMADLNSVITRRIMRGSDANRPAETDVQRVQWLLGTTEFGSVVTTSRYVSTLFPVAMDAVDYRDQSNQQILDDCSQASGKNYFIFWDEPVAGNGLFYDFAGSSTFRSSIRLTNILGYIDNDITYGVISESTKLNRDPSRVFSGVILPFVGGEVYVQNDAIATEFFRRDTTAPSVNVKSSAKATARANRYINDARTEADRISTAFLVPIAKVNHLQVGQAVQCWFSHFPGYETGWNWMRVLNRTVTATSEEFYTVEVELASAVGGLDAGGGVTSEGVTVPAPPIVEPTPLQTCVGLNGLTYTYTAAGTREPLGLVWDHGPPTLYRATSTDFLGYGNVSGYPNAGEACNAGNGGGGGTTADDCAGNEGGVDYFTGGPGSFIIFRVIGPGTLTINTTGNGLSTCAGPAATTLNAVAIRTDTAVQVDTDTQPPGTPLVVTIPDEGFCGHYVKVNGPEGATHIWGLVNATWAPAP